MKPDMITFMPTDTNYSQLAKIIKAEMKAQELSTRDLEDKSGISRDTISRITRGVGPFSATTLTKVAEALNLDPDYIKQVAGLIKQRSVVIRNADVLDLAKELDELSEEERAILLPNIRQLVNVYRKVISVSEEASSNPVLAWAKSSHSDLGKAAERGYIEAKLALDTALADGEFTLEEWRELREIDPEAANSFLEKQLGPNWRAIVADVQDIRVSFDNEGDEDQAPVTSHEDVG